MLMWMYIKKGINVCEHIKFMKLMYVSGMSAAAAADSLQNSIIEKFQKLFRLFFLKFYFQNYNDELLAQKSYENVYFSLNNQPTFIYAVASLEGWER